MSLRGRTLSAAVVAVLALGAGRASASNDQILNPRFNSGVGFWTIASSPGLSSGWTDKDGAAGAGSYHVMTSAVLNTVVLAQCLNVQQAFQYTFGTYYKVSSAYAGRPTGRVSVGWKSAPDCGGNVLRPDDTPTLDGQETDSWLHLTKTVISPLGAKSAYFSLIVITPDATVGSAFFDDVSLIGTGILEGDASGDGTLDVADVFHLLNFLFAGGPAPYAPVDVNGDGEFDVSDVFYLVNYLFSSGPAPK
jgi:hypothetical protein